MHYHIINADYMQYLYCDVMDDVMQSRIHEEQTINLGDTYGMTLPIMGYKAHVSYNLR